MYAIVEIAGQQFKVEKDQQIFVHRLDSKEGEKITFDNVLLIETNGKVKVGAPNVSGAKVTAKVLEHLKGDKVIVFKKKRRKGYIVKNGHRQYLSKIEIQKIDEKAAAKKATPKKETKPKAVAKPKAKKATPKKETKPKAVAKPKAKKATAKKSTKKTTAKKTTKKAE
mgnify:CR=1 FL=1